MCSNLKFTAHSSLIAFATSGISSNKVFVGGDSLTTVLDEIGGGGGGSAAGLPFGAPSGGSAAYQTKVMQYQDGIIRAHEATDKAAAAVAQAEQDILGDFKYAQPA